MKERSRLLRELVTPHPARTPSRDHRKAELAATEEYRGGCGQLWDVNMKTRHLIVMVAGFILATLWDWAAIHRRPIWAILPRILFGRDSGHYGLWRTPSRQLLGSVSESKKGRESWEA
jgi:hypothetical protein